MMLPLHVFGVNGVFRRVIWRCCNTLNHLNFYCRCKRFVTITQIESINVKCVNKSWSVFSTSSFNILLLLFKDVLLNYLLPQFKMVEGSVVKETFNYLFADLSNRKRFTRHQVRLLVEKYWSSRFGSLT